jgi:tripartite-type tricarboxylate transporter receptor subunit TctC
MPMNPGSKLKAAFVVASSVLFACGQAWAQSYPAKPVKIVVAFPPGGGNDFIARFIAQRLSVSLGQQFVVENRPGAGGTIGVEIGLKAPPDGYTLTLISNSYTVNPSLYKIRFDPVADMTPVIQISQGPYVIVVHPSVPAKSLKELIELAKAKPDALFFASSGQGSVAHLATELFASMAGFKLNHVPYKGTGPALTDTIGGQTGALFGSVTTTLPHVRAGRLRALAVTTAGRLAAEPDIPTVAEAGVPGYETVLWHGLIGPKGLPAPIVERLNAEVTKVLDLKDTADQLQNDGVSPAGGRPEQFREAIRKEIELWRKVVSEAGVKLE